MFLHEVSTLSQPDRTDVELFLYRLYLQYKHQSIIWNFCWLSTTFIYWRSYCGKLIHVLMRSSGDLIRCYINTCGWPFLSFPGILKCIFMRYVEDFFNQSVLLNQASNWLMLRQILHYNNERFNWKSSSANQSDILPMTSYLS